MQIDGLLNKILEKSLLKRVRVKVDPRECINFHLSPYYEGYVLEECNTTVKVLFVNTPANIDPVQQVDKKHVDDIADPELQSKIDKLCGLLISKGIEHNHPVLLQLKNSKNLDFVDSYLRQLGFMEPAEIYKELAFTTEAVADIVRGVASGAARAASKAGRALTSPVAQTVYKDIIGKAGRTLGTHIPGLIAGKKSIFNRAANFLKSLDINDLINIKDIKWFEDQKIKPVKGSELYVINMPGLKYYLDRDKNKYNIRARNINERTTSDGNVEYVYEILEPREQRKKFAQIIVNYPFIRGTGQGSVKLISRNDKDNAVYAAYFTERSSFLYAEIGKSKGGELVDANALRNASKNDLSAFAKMLGGFQKIVSMGSITPDAEAYLLNITKKYYNNDDAKRTIASIIDRVTTMPEFKDAADDSRRVILLRKELENNGINLTDKT